MKKITLLILPLIMLTSCNNTTNESLKGTAGIIDCYSINVRNGDTYIYSGNYEYTYSRVYEYKSDDGNTLYFSNQLKYSVEYGSDPLLLTIRYYSDRFSSNYSDYNFNRYVGLLTEENNKLLDLDNNTVIEQLKFSEYKYDTNPVGVDGGNHKEAYECAKKGYFDGVSNGSIRQEDGKYFATIVEGQYQTNMERNRYISYGHSAHVTYVEKWF